MISLPRKIFTKFSILCRNHEYKNSIMTRTWLWSKICKKIQLVNSALDYQINEFLDYQWRHLLSFKGQFGFEDSRFNGEGHCQSAEAYVWAGSKTHSGFDGEGFLSPFSTFGHVYAIASRLWQFMTFWSDARDDEDVGRGHCYSWMIAMARILSLSTLGMHGSLTGCLDETVFNLAAAMVTI